MTHMTTRTNPVNKYTSRAEVIAVAMTRNGGLTAATTSWFGDPCEAVRAALHSACDTAAEYRDGCVMYCITSRGTQSEDIYVGVDAARLMTPGEAAAMVMAMPRHEDDDEKAIEALAAKIEKWRRMPC